MAERISREVAGGLRHRVEVRQAPAIRVEAQGMVVVAANYRRRAIARNQYGGRIAIVRTEAWTVGASDGGFEDAAL